MQRIFGLVAALIGWPIFVLWTGIGGIGILVGATLRPFERVRRGGWRALNATWGHMMWHTQPFWHRSFTGLENLQDGPYILVANHQSVIDIPAVFGLPLPLKVVAKRANFRIPIMGPFLGLSGQIHVDRFMEEGREALDAGLSVVVFAEGSRSTDGDVRRFRKGAFRLAVETGTPVVPIAVNGGQLILQKSQFIPTQLFAPVVVAVGAPVDGQDVETLRQNAFVEVRRMLHLVRERVVFTSAAHESTPGSASESTEKSTLVGRRSA